MVECETNTYEFKKLYDDVFTKDGTVKVCGRDKTKALIEYCSKINSSVDYGDINTGFLNVSNIHKLYYSFGEYFN